METVSLQELKRRALALGYTFDRQNDCRAVHKDGERYVTLYAVEADTGISFAHYKDARRDANFKAFQELRKNVVGYSKGWNYYA